MTILYLNPHFIKLLVFAFCISIVPFAHAQQPTDKDNIAEIFNIALNNGKSYEMLYELSTKIGPRLSGSPGAAAAVEWSRHVMQDLDFDSVWLQPVMVPHWVRGQEEARIVNSIKMGTFEINICSLGGSIGTGPAGISGEVIEVKNFEELRHLGANVVKGKIVFFNRPLNPSKINTFDAYGEAVNQRGSGAIEASKMGAVAAIIRSMGSGIDENPHTGGMRYDKDVPQIPAVAVSTKHAELLSKLLKDQKGLQVYIETHCQTLDDAPSFNVVGELRGGDFKDEIILVGGHLDSWDLAQGAHDDGAGCVQSIEALRLLKQLGYKPRRTIRAVMYMNEENGLRGGTKYAEMALNNKEKHIAAIESDRGGFTPRGFTLDVSEKAKSIIQSWMPLFEPYDIVDFSKTGGGADIGPLKSQGTELIGFLPDSQRYFDYHHTAIDNIEAVNKRELELGSAAMTALIFLIDHYGLK